MGTRADSALAEFRATKIMGANALATTSSAVIHLWLLLVWCLLFYVPSETYALESVAKKVAPHVQNVILVTLDGLRWQELFGGADDRLLNALGGGVKDVDGLRKRFVRESTAARRAALMPFFWNVIATRGQVFGAPEVQSVARVTNGLNFSYPGYHELLVGYADPRVNSNDKKNNPNVTVLEWLHQRPEYHGKVAAFCSWDVFPYILHTERSGIRVNAGWQPFDVATSPTRLTGINEAMAKAARPWPNARMDQHTFAGALEYLQVKKPRVLYVAFDETDDWGHARRYDLVLDAARRADEYLEKIWTTVQSMPEYKDQTALFITTDHGRGDTLLNWTDHGALVPGADRIWFAVLSSVTRPLGLRANVSVTQAQCAATVARLLGENYNAAVARAAPPLPGITGD